jgi:hypothetical protein
MNSGRYDLQQLYVKIDLDHEHVYPEGVQKHLILSASNERHEEFYFEQCAALIL